jgi:hypothetical protein
VPHGWHQPWFCTWCATPNLGFTQNQDPATATVAELATSVARTRLSFALAKDVQAIIGEPGPPVASSAAAAAAPEPEPAAPDVPVAARRSPMLALAACVLAIVAITTVWAVMRLDMAPSASRASGAGEPARQVSVTAAHVTSVIFEGVPGKLSVIGTGTTRVSLTGQLRWTGRPPLTATRFEDGGRVLLLSYRCVACTEDFQLTVPYGEAVTLNQSSARLTLTGLTGAISITATNVAVIATGLRTTALVASITSGTLTAGFEVAPSLVDVTLRSAQCTLRLPVSVRYQVSQRVADGNVTIAVPQGGTAANRVIAHVTSGDLELLAS